MTKAKPTGQSTAKQKRDKLLLEVVHVIECLFEGADAAVSQQSLPYDDAADAVAVAVAAAIRKKYGDNVLTDQWDEFLVRASHGFAALTPELVAIPLVDVLLIPNENAE